MDLSREIAVAIAAAREAGALAAQMQAGITSTPKADGSPVTAADLAADAIVRQHLTLHFPDDALLSEETADDAVRLSSSRLWIVDPIDGTKEYAKGRVDWAVQLALVIDGRVVLGVLDLGAQNLCVVGVPGLGAWLIDRDGQRPLRARTDVRDVLITSTGTRNRAALERVHAALPEFAWTTCTSVGVKVWKMLCGEADLYVHPNTIAEWDVAAPAAVLAAAGGIATDLAGAPLVYNTAAGRHPGLVFSVRSDHAALVERLAAASITVP